MRTWLPPRGALGLLIVVALTTAATAPVDARPARDPSERGIAPVTPATPAVRGPHRRPQVTVAVSGDILLHTPVVASARANAGGSGYDFAPMFARLEPLVGEVDIGICHLETPVAPPGQAISSHPIYGVPREIATGITAAGYDRCSTASNHTLDRGTAGIDATVDALVDAGLAQAGMARTPDEAIAPVLSYNALRVAHLSYTFGFNGGRLPADQPWRSALIDPARIVRDAADSRRRGAQAVVVSLHWGIEGSAAPSAYQRSVAQAVTSSGQVDLIVGHHAHVLQPIEKINGVWVIFGLGNSLSNMPTGPFGPASQDGAVVTTRLRLTAAGTIAVSRPVVHPTWVDRENRHVIRLVLEDLADPTVPERTKAGLRQSLARTRGVLGAFVPAG